MSETCSCGAEMVLDAAQEMWMCPNPFHSVPLTEDE